MSGLLRVARRGNWVMTLLVASNIARYAVSQQHSEDTVTTLIGTRELPKLHLAAVEGEVQGFFGGVREP